MKKYLTHIVEHGTPEERMELVDKISEGLDVMKMYSTVEYNKFEKELKAISNYECLSEDEARTWVSKMKNNDGTIGEHWSVEQTTRVAESYNIRFDKFSRYDWYVVLNMMYSDYYGAVSNDVNTYTRMAVAFLEDKDAEDDKLYRYYKQIVRQGY